MTLTSKLLNMPGTPIMTECRQSVYCRALNHESTTSTIVTEDLPEPNGPDYPEQRSSLGYVACGMGAPRYDTFQTWDPKVAASFLRNGQLVAFPTETVFGIGAAAFDAGAVRRIYEVKRRPPDNPLIVHTATRDQITSLAQHIPPVAAELMDRFFPGALTIVLPKHPALPSITTGGLGTVAIRMPAEPTAQAFLAACGTPVAAPSANISGRPSATTWQAVLEDLDGAIACILQGSPVASGLESTVVDCTGPIPRLLRPGTIALEDLDGVQLQPAQQQLTAPSPGMRYRHYAPNARVIMVDTPAKILPHAQAAFIGMDQLEKADQFALVRHCHGEEDYGRSLYNFFRQCERLGVTHIYCQTVNAHGIGRAIMDRIVRASSASPKST